METVLSLLVRSVPVLAYALIALVGSVPISAPVFAQAPATRSAELAQFLKMEDDAKIEFLVSQTTAIEDPAAIKAFAAKNRTLMTQLKQVGLKRVDVWYDTILEGDYVLNGSPKISLLTVHEKQGTVFGLMGIVTVPAVSLPEEGCTYNETTRRYSGEHCNKTSISEIFYIDALGKFIESENYPEDDQ